MNWKRFAPKRTKDGMTFPLLEGDEKVLFRIVEKLPVEWHSTTPRNFECQQNCFHCCSMCWFNKNDLSKLPQKYRSGLVPNSRPGLTHVRTVYGKCIFYDETSPFCCTIRDHRPLRCRIYPFTPILDTSRSSIVILAQDIMKSDRSQPATLCYGLGNGKDISVEAKEHCREYLLCTILEQSYSRFLWMGKAENFINKRSLKLREKPLYRTFAECDAARLQAVRTHGIKKFASLLKKGSV